MNEHRGERGQILPLIAVCLAVLLGFAGFAVDLGYMQYELRQQQTAADAAAIGGARELITAGCASPVAAKTAAKNDASENGFTDGTNKVKVTAYNPPQTGALTSNGCAVQVTVYSPHATFFGRIFRLCGRRNDDGHRLACFEYRQWVHLFAATLRHGKLQRGEC